MSSSSTSPELNLNIKIECSHQFIHLCQITKPIPNVTREIYGAEIGCALCGQVRHVWGDGVLEIKERDETKEESIKGTRE